MTPPPEVSVIVPTFQMASSLNECLESIFNSTGVNLEVIVCDGAGDEATSAVIKNFPGHALTHLVEPDHGVYDAMNKGVNRSKGEWLFFIGADDVVASPQALQDLLNNAEPADRLLLARVKNLPPRHRFVPEWHVPKWNRSLLLKNTVHHQGALYHRSLFNKYRYPSELLILGDYHLNLSLFTSGIQTRITDIHLASCAQGGLSKRFKPSLYKEEWWLKRAILPVGSTWWQPLWLVLKYLRKQVS